MSNQPIEKTKKPFRKTLEDIIFRHDTPASKAFDVTLLVLISISVVLVMLESVKTIDLRFHDLLRSAEWILTILFTIEYVLRIYSTDRKWSYITSTYGIIDLVSIVPTFLTLFDFSTHYLTTIRALRLLRVFRILKMSQFLIEGSLIWDAVTNSRKKITVFLAAVMTCSIILGTMMYMIEGDDAGFTSIPRSIYWAIVTLTTVGYGDISPQTPIGQALAAFIMIMGYGIIAVPTGIVTAELVSSDNDLHSFEISEIQTISCPYCDADGLDKDSVFCKKCGREVA